MVNDEKEAVRINLQQNILNTKDGINNQHVINVTLEKISEEMVVKASRIGTSLMNRAIEKDKNKIRHTLNKESPIQYLNHSINPEIYDVPLKEVRTDVFMNVLEDEIENALYMTSIKGINAFWVLGEKGRWFKEKMEKKGFITSSEKGENVWEITLRKDLFYNEDKQCLATEKAREVLNEYSINAFLPN